MKDGQQAGEMLLDIETRIGEIASAEEKAKPVPKLNEKRQVRGAEPSGSAPKHERLGLRRKHMKDAQKIAQHPEVVKQGKQGGYKKITTSPSGEAPKHERLGLRQKHMKDAQNKGVCVVLRKRVRQGCGVFERCATLCDSSCAFNWYCVEDGTHLPEAEEPPARGQGY